jgi:hypothetical protein
VSLGNMHSCAIVQGGALYCWGDDGWGQVGTGSGSASPMLVSAISGIVDVNADVYNTYALDSANVTWGWGANANGDGYCDLGYVNLSAQSFPIRVYGLPPATMISGGSTAGSMCIAVPFGS